jgi:hypothetical protein
LAAVSSALSTRTYVFQVATGGAPSGAELMAATSPPLRRAMRYCPGEPAGMVSSSSQPNNPP